MGKSNKSHQNCCVYGCHSIRKRDHHLSFHKFPSKGRKAYVQNQIGELEQQEQLLLWENALRLGRKSSKHMRVCSLHFQADDFEQSGWSSRIALKPNVIPSQKIPQRMHDNRQANDSKIAARKHRYESRQQRRQDQVSFTHTFTDTDSRDTVQDAAAGLLMLQSGIQEIDNPLFKEVAIQVNMEELGFTREHSTQTDCSNVQYQHDAECQVNTNDILTLADFVTSDKQLWSITGLHSFLLLNTLVNLYNICFNKQCGRYRLSVRNRIFLTFCKLKLNLPYVVLSILFNVSGQTCKNVFFETIVNLSLILKPCVHFPSKDEILKNMPKCFANFKKVRVVLHCTEVAVQRPTNLCCQIKCYSHYKGTTTLKFMIGVTPGGLISYISPAFGGRTSDKAIFERSKLLDDLDMYHDAVMVDKGFLIDQLCESFGIEIIRPPFLRKKKKFSQAEAKRTAEIASARVHIERTNQRIKTFEIVSNRLSVNLVPVINEIFLVISAIVNLSNPILSEDKFL